MRDHSNTQATWLSNRMSDLTKENAGLSQELYDATKGKAHEQRRAEAAERKLAEWELWWAWAAANAGPKEAGRFSRLGAKRPRRLSDRGGPQGSQ